jgi:N-acylneuraminate cytidylyltransferase
VLHALRALPEKYDLVVLLQPTSPLRAASDIDACVELCVTGRFQSCVSVTLAEQSPYWMFLRVGNGRLKPLLGAKGMTSRRQDLPKVYVLNGAVYVAVRKALLKNRSFVTRHTAAWEMPPERALDIDTSADFENLKAFMRARATGR